MMGDVLDHMPFKEETKTILRIIGGLEGLMISKVSYDEEAGTGCRTLTIEMTELTT